MTLESLALMLMSLTCQLDVFFAHLLLLMSPA